MRVDAKNQVSKHLRVLNSPLLAYALEICSQHGEAEFHSFPALWPAEMSLQKVWKELISPASQSPSPLGLVAGKENNVYTLRIYIRDRGWLMGTARIFRSGNSQAVRLPKQFRLKSKEVEIFRRGDEIVLREKDGTMVRAFDLLANLPDDLEFVGREKDPPQKRKGL
jgi:antitoxin VapB